MNIGVETGEWPSEELPGNWSWFAFDQFWIDCTDSRRKVPQNQYMLEGKLAVIDQGAGQIGGYTNNLSMRSAAPLPAVVFGDHTRVVKYVDLPFAQGADGVRVLVPGSGVNPLFAFHALRCVRLPDKGYSRHFKFLKDTVFPLAPLLEQRRIVAKIDSLSSKSKRAREHFDHIPPLVEKFKQAVLATTFGKVNESAKLEPLQQCASFVTSGSRGWAKYYSSQGAFFIRVGNVKRGQVSLSFDDIQCVSPPKGAEGQRTLVQHNDIVVTITADLGRIGLVPNNLGEAYVNQHIALIRMKNANYAPFVSWFLTSQQGQAQLLKNNRGATRAGLGLDDIRGVCVPLPSVAEQNQVVSHINRAFTWIDRLAAEAASARKLIDQLDQAVLAKAFRGELVPQDPNDEPASVLLERIRAERVSTPAAKHRRRRAREQA